MPTAPIYKLPTSILLAPQITTLQGTWFASEQLIPVQNQSKSTKATEKSLSMLLLWAERFGSGAPSYYSIVLFVEIFSATAMCESASGSTKSDNAPTRAHVSRRLFGSAAPPVIIHFRSSPGHKELIQQQRAIS
jgi:hypothetical protein